MAMATATVTAATGVTTAATATPTPTARSSRPSNAAPACASWNFGHTPGDLLGLCHGAAGVLAVADALARHARLPAAAALAVRLRGRLLDRLPDALAGPWPGAGC
ncbi:hypothetical protein ACLQ2E_04235 [Streptomyces lavendulocolor]